MLEWYVINAVQCREKAALAAEVLQKALQLKEVKKSGGVVREASDVSEQVCNLLLAFVVDLQLLTMCVPA